MAREARKLTQDQLVSLVPGSTQAALSALEVRDSKTAVLLFEYADALNVNPRWLLTGHGDSWITGVPARTSNAAPMKDRRVAERRGHHKVGR